MSLEVLDSTTRTALGAATSQTGQLTALAAVWSGNVLVRYYTSADVLLGTATHSGWDAIDTGTTPYSRTLAGLASPYWTPSTTGTATYCVVAVPSGADILRATLTSPISVIAGSRVNLDDDAGGSGLRINASASLPVDDMPAWLSGASINAWKEITGTTITSASNGIGSVSANIMDGYGGIGLLTSPPRVAARGGGHETDGTQNEGMQTNIGADSPAWSVLWAPTPVADRVNSTVWLPVSGSPKTPATCHTYDSIQFSAATNSLLYFGLASPPGAGGSITGSAAIFRYMVGSSAWAQPGSADDWGAYPVSTSGDFGDGANSYISGTATCQGTDGAIYTIGTQRIFKFVPSTQTWSRVVNDGNLNHDGWGLLLMDTTRSRMLRVMSQAGTKKYYTINTDGTNVTDVTSSLNGGTGLVTELLALSHGDAACGCYDPINDRYLMLAYSNGRLLAVNASTWEVTAVQPTGYASVPNPPTAGAQGRLKYCDELKGVVYCPRGSANVWFLPLQAL